MSLAGTTDLDSAVPANNPLLPEWITDHLYLFWIIGVLVLLTFIYAGVRYLKMWWTKEHWTDDDWDRELTHLLATQYELSKGRSTYVDERKLNSRAGRPAMYYQPVLECAINDGYLQVGDMPQKALWAAIRDLGPSSPSSTEKGIAFTPPGLAAIRTALDGPPGTRVKPLPLPGASISMKTKIGRIKSRGPVGVLGPGAAQAGHDAVAGLAMDSSAAGYGVTGTGSVSGGVTVTGTWSTTLERLLNDVLQAMAEVLRSPKVPAADLKRLKRAYK